jgi:hypothetical protein
MDMAIREDDQKPRKPPEQRERFSNTTIIDKRNDPRDTEQDVDAEPVEQDEGAQTGGKSGKQSSAKRMESTRHNLAPHPASGKVGGASGAEPEEEGPA